MSLVLTGTAATILRDLLIKEWFEKKITPSQISERLKKIDLPEILESQILQMVNYRNTERITCPIELAMEKAVHAKFLERIIQQEKLIAVIP